MMKVELEYTKQGIEDDWNSASVSWKDEAGETFGQRGIGSISTILQSGIENDNGFDFQIESCRKALQSYETSIRLA